jgi:von Willebrand factor type A domain/FHA domain
MSIARSVSRVRLGVLGLLAPLVFLPAPAVAEPALIALLLDTSGSIRTEDLGRVQTLARNLLSSLPRGWEMAVYKFNDDSKLILERTSQVEQVERVIGSLRQEGKHTALYDALFDASEYLESQAGPRKIILLLTDGKNDGGHTDLEDGLEIARRQRIPVFAIGIGRDVNTRVLRRIATRTGGTYMDLATATGQTLAQAIRRAAGDVARPTPPAPVPTPATSPPGNSSSGALEGEAIRQKDTRLLWILALAGVAIWLAGLILWKARGGSSRTPAAPSSIEPVSMDGTQRINPVDDVRTVQEPALTLGPTIRIRLKPGSLVVKEGQGTGLIFPVRPGDTTLLGRSPTADVPVDDPTVSSEHCRIVPSAGVYLLHDLGSTNGTLVNGAPVRQHVLCSGDVIQVGNTRLEFKN